MKKILIGFVVGILVVFGYQQLKNNNSVIEESSGPIIIGGIAPLSGDEAPYGIMTQRISELEIEKINKEGGINGRPLKIIWEDGKCTPGDASRSAQKLTGVDKVSVILGGVCSGETLGAAPITERKQVILLSPISTSAEVTLAGDFVFRTSPSDAGQGRVLADYANDKFKKVGILSEQTDYASALANIFEESFTGEVVREDFLSTEADFKTRITKLKNENLDGLFINPQTPAKYEIIIKQLQEQNWELPIILNEICVGETKVADKFSEFLTKNKATGTNFVAPENKKFKDFVAKYETRFGEVPPYFNYAATNLDAINVITKVLREEKNTNDTKAIRDALYATQDFDGTFGKLSFDENGDVNITFLLFEFNGEEFILISE